MRILSNIICVGETNASFITLQQLTLPGRRSVILVISYKISFFP